MLYASIDELRRHSSNRGHVNAHVHSVVTTAAKQGATRRRDRASSSSGTASSSSSAASSSKASVPKAPKKKKKKKVETAAPASRQPSINESLRDLRGQVMIVRSRARRGMMSTTEVSDFADAAWFWLKTLAVSNDKLHDALKLTATTTDDDDDVLGNLDWAVERSQAAVRERFDPFLDDDDDDDEDEDDETE